MNACLFQVRIVAIACLLMVWGMSMSACAVTSTFTWKEEVLLHDGKRIVVERSDTYDSSMNHELGQGPPLAEHTTTFMIPGVHHQVTWKSNNRPLPDPDNLNLLALDFLNGVPYVATTPSRSFAYIKWNQPNPPYVFFKYTGEWKRVSLEEFPEQFKINVIVHSLQHGPYKKKVRTENHAYGFVRAQTVAELNREPGSSKEYYSILRAPFDYGPSRGNSGKKIRTKDGWMGMDWFEGQPSLEACTTLCEKKHVSSQDCPCRALFQEK
ncbi:MAG: hypothetical protein WA045_08985 [Nitrospira sp.]